MTEFTTIKLGNWRLLIQGEDAVGNIRQFRLRKPQLFFEGVVLTGAENGKELELGRESTNAD